MSGPVPFCSQRNGINVSRCRNVLPSAERRFGRETRAAVRIDIFTMATLANGPQNLINK